jgi:hypothetical protein
VSQPAVAVALVLDMIERRDALKRLYGKHYAAVINPFRSLLRGTVAATGEPLRDVAHRMAKEISDFGGDPSILIAAFVEESGL